VLIKKIKEFFGVGNIAIDRVNGFAIYYVRSLKALNVILAHFIIFPLITQKRADFELFQSAIEIISRKEHLTPVGLQEIVNIKASLNRGLSENLVKAFPDTIPVERPKVDLNVTDPQWLAGFVDGEGCFSVEIRPSTRYKTGYQVSLRFSVSQHLRDLTLLKSFIKYFECGLVRESSRG
jgi:hypothetical protein